MDALAEDLVESVRRAAWVVVLTGAGVSAESGIATFRDAMTGMWARFRPEELATPEAFERDPERVSRWYDERRCGVAGCRPNAGHIAIARLQREVEATGRRFTLITQNVDRLHQAAGSSGVIELHGTLWVWRCVDCLREREERGEAFGVYPVRCECGGLRRPGVVWFNEALPPGALLEAERAAGNCDLFLTLGTSGVVYPAAGLVYSARRNNARVLEVNPQATPASASATWVARETTGSFMPRLVEAAFGK